MFNTHREISHLHIFVINIILFYRDWTRQPADVDDENNDNQRVAWDDNICKPISFYFTDISQLDCLDVTLVLKEKGIVIIYRASSRNITSIDPFIIFIDMFEFHFAELSAVAGSLKFLIIVACKLSVTESAILVYFFFII